MTGTASLVRDLAGGFNLAPTEVRALQFAQAVVASASQWAHPRILDVGCGEGIDKVDPEGGALALENIARVAEELWGVEPDLRVPISTLYTKVIRGALSADSVPSNYFHVVYAHYVAEHVKDAADFLSQVCRVLTPGGVFLMKTPNANHYFVRVARMLKRLNADEIVLRVLRRDVNEYHYPTAYQLNTPSEVWRVASEVGFGAMNHAYVEHKDLDPYFPPLLRPVRTLLDHLSHRNRQPESLVGLLIELQKL